MRHTFNTFKPFKTFLSTSASALPSLHAFPFHPCLQSLTRIQPTIIQRVPRRQTSDFPSKKDRWEFRLKNIRPGFHTPLGPRSNPNFYRIDLSVKSPPSSYYISNFWKKTAEAFDVESLVRTHVTPRCSIQDIAEPLASDILAKFPAAFNISVNFQPYIPEIYDKKDLFVASCAFHIKSTQRPTQWSIPVERPLDEHNSWYEVITQWRLPISLPSGYMVSLSLTTEERCASTVHDRISSSENPRFRPSLNRVHPTFGLHHQVTSIAAEELQSGSVEGAALYIARYLFHLADEQSPCKRIQSVTVTLRDMVHLSEEVRSQTSKYRETRQHENVTNAFTHCSVRLDRRHYEQSQGRLRSKDFQSGRHRAFLALGSNLGNRVEMIESAVREMGDRGLSVSRTSALYETKPMYLENQESFINGACEVCSTNISYR